MSPGCGTTKLTSGVSYLTWPLDRIAVNRAASETGTIRIVAIVRRSNSFFSIRLTRCFCLVVLRETPRLYSVVSVNKLTCSSVQQKYTKNQQRRRAVGSFLQI
jgi:hypothetical protein